MKSKILKVLILSALLVTTMVACGNKTDKESSKTDNTSSSVTESTDTSKTENNKTEAEVIGMTNYFDIEEQEVKLVQFGDYSNLPKATLHTTMGDIEIAFFPEYAPKTVENFLTHAKEGYYDGLIFHRVINDFMIQGGDPQGTGIGGESIWGEPFQDELSPQLYNFRGAISMANSGVDTNGSQFFIVQSKGNQFANLPDMLYSNRVQNNIERIQKNVNKMLAEGKDKKEIEQYITEENKKIEATINAGVPEYYGKMLEPVIAKYQEVGGTPHLDNKHAVFGQVINGMDVVDKIAAVEQNPQNNKPVTDVVINSITVVGYDK